ncbi:hypothetical protein Acr_15g0006100 [Actinidia rufa]|uniref:Uncharacterized protein n=1 Tax=Actinidia rufa TaxID=165716 RepID=A0A7J0FTI7_9ERIC|nr:hypothetical protein Acr_15g0006100 [Actinidia rufa]
MSENKDNVAGLDDKGKPKLKDLFSSDVQKQGIASASTNPTERDIDDTEGNLDSLSMEGNASSLNLSEPSGELSDTVQSQHKAIPASEFELPFSSSIIKSLGKSFNRDPNPTKVGSNMGIFLFEVYLAPKDVQFDRLSIPMEQALDHFPPLADRRDNYDEKIKISDPENLHLNMTLRCDLSEFAFVMDGWSNWWSEVVRWHKLKVMDVVRFYRPLQPLQENHYLIDFVKRSQQVASIPEFRQENYLFKVQVTAASIMSRRLIVPTEAVRSHFSAVGIPAETHGLERLYFTDALIKEWIVEITVYGSSNPTYMLILEEAFVGEYDLENEDAIKFYKSVQPLNARHFLIEFVKRGEAVTDTSQSGSAENEGDGDDGGRGSSSSDDGTRGDSNRQGGGHSGGRRGRDLVGNICAA